MSRLAETSPVPDLTIVIPSYETADRLETCVDALARSAEQHPQVVLEVIVVDNGSRDDSVLRARRSPLSPRVVALVRNRGFAAAVNRGLDLRRGRHVLLLNSDVIVDAAMIPGGLARLDQDPTIGLLGPALRHADGRVQRSAHPIPDLWTELLPEWLVDRLRVPPVKAGGLREVEALRGAVLFIRGDLVEKLGPLDEGYFFFLEDTDYCARARSAGVRVVEDSALFATHSSGASSKRRVPLATRIEFHRSLYRFLERSSGRLVARVARGVRTVRSLVSLLLLVLPTLVSEEARRRLAERFGLVLWHLRGCPPDPALASALLESTGSGRGEGEGER
jgi:GT2 family glycosyltransferase